MSGARVRRARPGDAGQREGAGGYIPRVPLHHADPDTCEVCGAPLVCFICETCPAHCLTDGDPDACWEAHESWRLGKGDPSFGPGAFVGRPPLMGSVPAAPRPRWRS